MLTKNNKKRKNMITKFENLNVIGLMGMAPNTDDKEILHKVFSRIREIKDRLNAEIFNVCISIH